MLLQTRFLAIGTLAYLGLGIGLGRVEAAVEPEDVPGAASDAGPGAKIPTAALVTTEAVDPSTMSIEVPEPGSLALLGLGLVVVFSSSTILRRAARLQTS